MVRSSRVSSSFAHWTSAGDDATVSSTRKAVVADLQSAVSEHQFDSETLQDIIRILEHECLCWKYYNDGKLPAGQDAGAFRQTLETSRTNQLVMQLSDCLVRSISPSSHYERELQSKALLSAFALLHAQGVRALQATFHDDLRTRIADRFTDLKGVPGQKAVFAAETVRKIQSGYYLCLAAEYAKHFQKAEPIVVSVVSSLVNLLIVGGSITSAAMVCLLKLRPRNLALTCSRELDLQTYNLLCRASRRLSSHFGFLQMRYSRLCVRCRSLPGLP